MKKLFDDGLLSVDEFKVSSLVLCLFACIIVSIIAFFTTGTIDNGLLNLTLGLIYSVAGINAVRGASNLIVSKNTSSSVSRENSEEKEDNKGDYKV